MRAKVAASAAGLRKDAGAAAAKRREAAAYLERAIALLSPPPPRLVAAGGLSGTGKTAVARSLAPWLGPAPGAVVVRSDVIRKRLFGAAETERLPPEAYEPAVTERVYALMAERAAAVLAAGHAVVADAVHARPHERDAIERVAREAGVAFRGIWLEADVEARAARVAARTGDASDATAEVARLQERYDIGPLSGWFRVDAGASPEETARRAGQAADV